MTRRSFDVDIDVSPDTDKSKYAQRAALYNEDAQRATPHPSGYYIGNDLPVDPITDLVPIPLDIAEEDGLMKVDLLNNSSYTEFSSKDEVLECVEKEPDWDMLLDADYVKTLPHIGKHHLLVAQLKPRSVMDIADALALIRPGKSGLLDQYMKNKSRTRKELYKIPLNGGMYFKKSHAVAYAMMIVCIMNKQSKKKSIFVLDQ